MPGVSADMSRCALGVTISDSRKFEHGSASTHSEQRVTTEMVVCMHISSHLKEYDIIRASDGDVSVTWVVMYDTSDIRTGGI